MTNEGSKRKPICCSEISRLKRQLALAEAQRDAFRGLLLEALGPKATIINNSVTPPNAAIDSFAVPVGV